MNQVYTRFCLQLNLKNEFGFSKIAVKHLLPTAVTTTKENEIPSTITNQKTIYKVTNKFIFTLRYVKQRYTPYTIHITIYKPPQKPPETYPRYRLFFENEKILFFDSPTTYTSIIGLK